MTERLYHYTIKDAIEAAIMMPGMCRDSSWFKILVSK